jgi:hypothetical protein
MKMFLGKLFCCRSELTFYAIPNEVRDPSALACLGKTSRSTVPNEVKDASLTLGKTKEGLIGKTKKDARQDKVGGT